MVNIDYLYNHAAAKKHFTVNRFVDKKLGFQIIENGTILPYKKIIDGKFSKDGWGFGGIVDGKDKFIESSFVYAGCGLPYTPPKNQFDTVQKLSFISECSTVHGDTP